MLYRFLQQCYHRYILDWRRGLEGLRLRRQWDFLVLHNGKYTSLPPRINLPLLCGHLKGSLRDHPDLEIVLIHNYSRTPIAEYCLRYCGLRNFTLINPGPKPYWLHTYKMEALRNYLHSGHCAKPYVMFMDCADCVILDHPEKALDLLREKECEVLFSNSAFVGGYPAMPQAWDFAKKLAEENGRPNRYLNSGVYIGKTAAVRELLDRVMQLVDHQNPPDKEDFQALVQDGVVSENFTDFPYNCGCDQHIIRSLLPEFYPRVKVDFEDKLAFRE